MLWRGHSALAAENAGKYASNHSLTGPLNTLELPSWSRYQVVFLCEPIMRRGQQRHAPCAPAVATWQAGHVSYSTLERFKFDRGVRWAFAPLYLQTGAVVLRSCCASSWRQTTVATSSKERLRDYSLIHPLTQNPQCRPSWLPADRDRRTSGARGSGWLSSLEHASTS